MLVDVVYRLRRGSRSCLYSGLSDSTGLSDFRGDRVFSWSDPGNCGWDRGCKRAGSCDVEAVGLNSVGVVSIPNSLWALLISFCSTAARLRRG